MKQIATALLQAKRAFGPALKSKVNPHFKSKYADLTACLEAVDQACLDNGILLYQETFTDLDGITIETVFLHESGEALRCGKLHVPAAKNDPQGYGSALSYARRYSLMTACGIAAEDDDGQSASTAKKPESLSISQCREITDLMTETKSDFEAFMQWIGKAIGQNVTSLNQVPSEAYEPIVKQLKKKKAITA